MKFLNFILLLVGEPENVMPRW